MMRYWHCFDYDSYCALELTAEESIHRQTKNIS